MIEPRTALDMFSRDDVKFLGGTPKFDLWVVVGIDVIEAMPSVRVRVVDGSRWDWDIFRLPMDRNRDTWSPIGEVRGRWGDVILTRAEANEIETYLRCFAPWVFAARREAKEENNNE